MKHGIFAIALTLTASPLWAAWEKSVYNEKDGSITTILHSLGTKGESRFGVMCSKGKLTAMLQDKTLKGKGPSSGFAVAGSLKMRDVPFYLDDGAAHLKGENVKLLTEGMLKAKVLGIAPSKQATARMFEVLSARADLLSLTLKCQAESITNELKAKQAG